jgi:hypothetical protein
MSGILSHVPSDYVAEKLFTGPRRIRKVCNRFTTPWGFEALGGSFLFLPSISAVGGKEGQPMRAPMEVPFPKR